MLGSQLDAETLKLLLSAQFNSLLKVGMKCWLSCAALLLFSSYRSEEVCLPGSFKYLRFPE